MCSSHAYPAAFVTILIAALLTGCSDHGDVELQNGTGWPATGVLSGRAADLESGQVMGISVEFDRFLVWGSPEKRVDYEFEGWTAFPQGGSVWAEPDATQRITVLADAGCLGVSNETPASIDAIYLVPPSSPGWGPDLLGGYLRPGEFALWTVDPGYWDARIEFRDGTYAEIFDAHVARDKYFDIMVVGLLMSGDSADVAALRQSGAAASRRCEPSRGAGAGRCLRRWVSAEDRLALRGEGCEAIYGRFDPDPSR